MKNIFANVLFLLSFSLAAFAVDNDPVKPRQDAQDPAAPYHDYGAAMSHKDGYAMAVEWHNANAKNLDAAVSPDVLASFVASEAAADALLAQVKGAYDTDPMVATQIAAVSQWVMMDDDVAWYDFWSDTPHADGRKVWVKALVARAEKGSDAYVQLFCLDQLRWCGCPCPCVCSRIAAIGEKSTDKHVKEMVCIVLRTLK